MNALKLGKLEEDEVVPGLSNTVLLTEGLSGSMSITRRDEWSSSWSSESRAGLTLVKHWAHNLLGYQTMGWVVYCVLSLCL